MITSSERETRDDIFPSGAYIIRNKETSSVLHIANVRVVAGGCPIISRNQDEINYRDQQIWWVERLPEDEEHGTKGEIAYSITNTASGLGTEVGGESTEAGSSVIAFAAHGGYNHRWQLKRVCDESDEETWSIIGVGSGLALAFENTTLQSETEPQIQKLAPQNHNQCWEFLRPLVAVPAGWLEITNIGTGNQLSQKYLSSPPLLLPQNTESNGLSSRHRERWATQWTIVLPSSHPHRTRDIDRTWIVRNRLTGGRLRCSSQRYGEGHELSVISMVDQPWMWVWPGELWILEPVDENVWKIRSHENSCLLEETNVPVGKGKELACVNAKYVRGYSNKTWSFRYLTTQLSPLSKSIGFCFRKVTDS